MFEDLQVLLKPQHHRLWIDYCSYLNMGWQRFAGNRFDMQEKFTQLRLLENAIRRDFPVSENLLARLQKQFVAENLSLYLLLEPLSSWRYLASGKAPDSDAAISEIVQRAVSPAARLLMVLNDENPSTYLPMTSWLTAMFLKQAVTDKSSLLKNMKRTPKQWGRKFDGLLKNAFVLLGIVHSTRLKFRIAMLLNTMRLSVRNMQNNKQVKTDFLDRIKIFLYSIYQFITIRKRSTTKKGI
ncbi:MAG: hypothetical protein IJ770_00725 [Alphaproteobacteria bacterium]|nr:hypothetical protein [Alphaproteobacteria bacterium]